MEKTTKAKEVHLVAHTTSGLEFEVVDAVTGTRLTDRMFWCSDEDMEEDEDIEDLGWEYFRRRIRANGWVLKDIVWS